MPPGGAALSRNDQASYAASLRAGKVAAIRAKETQQRSTSMGKVLPLRPGHQLAERPSLPTRQETEGNVVDSPSPSRIPPRDEYMRNHMQNRMQAGVGFSNYADKDDFPSFDAANDEEGFTDDENYEQAMLENQLEAQQTEDQGRLAQLKSRARNMAQQQWDQQMKKFMSGMKKQLTKRQTDVMAKGASTVDAVDETAGILDTTGVAISAIQTVETIFEGAIPDEVKEKLPIAPLDLANKDGTDIFSLDWLSAAGTIIQYGKWIAVLVFLLMMSIAVFLTMGSVCYNSFVCRTLYL